MRWLPTYQRGWFRFDLVAGVTVGAVLIPSALSYAAIVGVAPIYGLYTVPFALLAYAIFGGSRLLTVGPDAALSVVAANTITLVAADGDQRVKAMVALSILSGVLFVVARLLRMGWMADLVPEPVLTGFIQGLVWVTVIGQIPSLLGLKLGPHGSDIWRTSWETIRSLGTINGATAALGVGSLVALWALRRYVRRVPGPLLVLIVSMILVPVLHLGDRGVSVVAEPKGGFIQFTLPTGLSTAQWFAMVPGALAIVVIGFAESLGAARMSSKVFKERVDPNEELLALGASNLAAGFSGGYVVTGALSKTSVGIESGGKTQVTNLVAAVVGLLALVVLRPLFPDMANTMLAALIVSAMVGLVDAGYFRVLWQMSRLEFWVSALTFMGVLTFGVLRGIVVGVVLSIVILLSRLGRPYGIYVPSGDPRITVYRHESPVLFLNARRTADDLRAIVDARPAGDIVIIDGSSVTAIDSTGLSAILDVGDDAERRGVELWFVGPDEAGETKIIDRSDGVLDRKFHERFATLDDALVAARKQLSSPA